MGCSCGISTYQHDIDPGDTCLYCAEKHLALCLSSMTSLGLKPGARQIVIGELELARRHTVEAYGELADSIADALQLVAARSDYAALDAVLTAADKCGELVDVLNAGDDSLKPVHVYTASTAGYNPLAGELYLCCGWRLASEQGYERANRRSMLGELTAAQYHLSQLSPALGERVRKARKSLEGRTAVPQDEWLSIMVDANAVVAEALAQGASTDLSWYIRR